MLNICTAPAIYSMSYLIVLCAVIGALDEPLMTATVKSIAAKKNVTVPNYDFVTHCRSHCITVSTLCHRFY